ncbi:MAG TPA: nucleotidyl transferase AbiEii/AbiGii toxin family protein [Woeseiaceae bacterium]
MASLREQYIERLIREIFLRKGSGFVLKGGGAMRALLGEQRLTKDVDLDFTNPKRSAESLHNTLRRAIAAAARGLPLSDLRVASPGKEEMSPPPNWPPCSAAKRRATYTTWICCRRQACLPWSRCAGPSSAPA